MPTKNIKKPKSITSITGKSTVDKVSIQKSKLKKVEDGWGLSSLKTDTELFKNSPIRNDGWGLSFLNTKSLKTTKKSSKNNKTKFSGGGSIDEVTDNYSINVNNNIIYFNGDIDEKSCVSLRKAIFEAVKNSHKLGLILNKKSIPIELHIESFGGELRPAFGIINLINNLDVDVYSFIDSYVEDSATLISVSCKKKFMSKYSLMMLHQLPTGVIGKYYVMTDDMKNKEQFMNTIKQIYIENSNIKKNELNNLLKKDTHLNPTKCLKLGLIDEII
jgi:ATP-dependent Clp protease protease subunit